MAADKRTTHLCTYVYACVRVSMHEWLMKTLHVCIYTFERKNHLHMYVVLIKNNLCMHLSMYICMNDIYKCMADEGTSYMCVPL